MNYSYTLDELLCQTMQFLNFVVIAFLLVLLLLQTRQAENTPYKLWLKVTPCFSLKFSYLVMKRGTRPFFMLCILLPSCGYFFSFTSRFIIK